MKFWRASSNFVYVFEYHLHTYFLRFSFEQHNTIEQIGAELDFMKYLIAHGHPSVKPVPSKNAAFIETVQMPEGNYYGVVFTQAAGIPVDTDSMAEHHFTRWGKSMAQLHSISQTYRPAGERRRDWREILSYVQDTLQRYPSEQDASVELERIQGWLASLPQSTGTFGLIHYDFQPDNVFWDDNRQQLHVFDFDDSMYHWFAMDIAAAIVEVMDEGGQESTAKLNWLLNGYRSILPLDDETVRQFPKFLRFSKLYGFSRILRSLENSDIADAPEWYEGLKCKLMRVSDQMRRDFQSPW